MSEYDIYDRSDSLSSRKTTRICHVSLNGCLMVHKIWGRKSVPQIDFTLASRSMKYI